jgi:hypothetical protein
MKDNSNQFLMVPYNLLSAAGYVKPDGECKKMNLTDKIIYAHIRNRFQFFKSLGKEYFDTQQAIASVCNMDIKATGNILRKFIKEDLTKIYKKPYGNFVKNVYIDVPPLHLWWKDKPVSAIFIDDYEYKTPEDFVDNLPDVNYYPESVFKADDLEY